MEQKKMVTRNCLVPNGSNPTKAQIKNHLRRIIEETHRHHKDKPGHYRINVLHGGAMSQFSKEELEEMGVTVRAMPNMRGERWTK